MRGYEDIIGLERPASRGHPPMSREKRAAQFMPFAALTGYEEAIAETARQTEPRPVLDEDDRAALDAALRLLAEKYNPGHGEDTEREISAWISHTLMLELRADELSGKQGKELLKQS